MKQGRNTFVWIALFSLCSVFFLFDSAQSYQDDFDVLKEENWEHWGKYAIWKTENGILKGWIQSPPDIFGDVQPTIELLQFKDSSGSYENIDITNGRELIQRQVKKPGYENFTITVQNLGVKHADFGITLGRQFPNFLGDDPFYYLFLTHRIYTRRFDGWGGWERWVNPHRTLREPRSPDTVWKTWELTSMEIRFNHGHFQWYVDGEKRADFEDPEFSPIEILGFVVIGYGLDIGHVWVDSFTISGSGLTVSPQAKLATTWGHFKQIR